MKSALKNTAATAWGLAAANLAIFLPVAPAMANDTAEGAWDIIRSVETTEVITETTYRVEKSFPMALSEGGIDRFELTGYVALTISDTDVEEFILVSDMGFCPYCGDPDHGATVQVKLSDPAATLQDGAKITVVGALTPIFDPETWQSTILEGAKITTAG